MAQKKRRNTYKISKQASSGTINANLTKQQLTDILAELHKRGKITQADLHDILAPGETNIPCSIFNANLSATESICKYLKEHLKLTYHDIAKTLSRDDRTVWTTYHNALAKQKKPLQAKKTDLTIPLSIFNDRTLTILEHLVTYLKESHNMKYSQIADLLKRDDRTIWTVYQRARKKRGVA